MPQQISPDNLKKDTSPVVYRSDVDGLRALAVLAVIAFHANAKLLPGGFAGVDIFFVISGFLISGLICKEVEQGTFSFVNFYTRRIKRILPVFAVVCVVTSGIALYLLGINDFVFFTTSLAASWAFASNVFFSLLSGGYFDTRFALFPLLHTWSLGVEEQFYFVFPILLASVLRYQRAHVLSIAVVSAVAFVLLSQVKSADPRAYYLLQYRAHELLIGLIALLAIRDYPIKSSVVADISCSIGLILTIGSLFLLRPTSEFPGLNSVYPCAGAALVIYSGAKAAVFRQVLTNRWLVLIGLMSYSLYLWHWPILSFLRYRGISLTAPVVLAAIASTFSLSYLSWNFVELPIRGNSRIGFRKAVTWFYLLPATAFLTFGLFSYTTGGFPSRFSPEIRELMSSYSREADLSRACSTRSIDDPTVSLSRLLEKCSFGDPTQGKAQILLFGDSHANHFKPFVDILASKAHLRGVYHVTGGCVPTARRQVNGQEGEPVAPACLDHNANMLKLAGNFRFVVFGGAWTTVKSGFEEDLRVAVDTVIRAGAIPVVFRDSPASDRDLSLCVLGQARGWLPPRTDCNIPYANVLQVQAEYEQSIDRVKAEFPTMIVVDPKSVICDATECKSRIGNLAVYRDSNHINERAAKMLAQEYIVAYGDPFIQ